MEVRPMVDENLLWILSLYRTSEISGSLFFGRLARSLRPGPVVADLTRHFADEAQHAWYWTECIGRLGGTPLGLDEAYQERYLGAAGAPANLMEVLAITQVFERRVINQYARHHRAPRLPGPVRETLARIMVDEKWHLAWVRAALRRLEPEWGRPAIDATLRRFWEADQAVYRNMLQEHADRVEWLGRGQPGGGRA
jgi:hypothetical protein